MEAETIIRSKGGEADDHFQLPGFRFHPTDEELVGFYLRRKVDKRPITIQLIKQVDIYKYDPWDLPKSSDMGDREWYFFCKRGRKYRNSVRPNRVTGSGFWKATGIDKPVYSGGGEGRCCIGLKKSLVYYSGSAGKGTKTDWMMHEFRLPASHDEITKHINIRTDINNNQEDVTEVWTLCRIFKRNPSSISHQAAANRSLIFKKEVYVTSNTCNMDSSDQNRQSSYISFTSAPSVRQTDENIHSSHVESIVKQQLRGHLSSSSSIYQQTPSMASLFSGSVYGDTSEFLRHTDWEDLQSVVGAAATDTSFYF